MVLLILIGLALVLAFCPTIRCAFFHPVKLVRYGVTDLYAYIKYRRWNECKTGELVAYVGCSARARPCPPSTRSCPCTNSMTAR